MADFDSALQPWKKLFNKYQPDTEIRHGFIGDGNGTVTVPDLPGWSWVRYDDIQSKLSMVRNHRYGLLPDGTPIVVGRRHHTDKYEQVLRVDFSSYASGMDQDTINQYILAPHGVSHRGLGSDPAPIDLNNIVVGKVVPDDPSSLSVEIYSTIYEYACEVILYDGEVLDLTAYVPGAPGMHRYVLVYLDQVTGAAGAIAGELGPIPAGPPDVPEALSRTIPLAIVLLVNGQTQIFIADIIQWKLLLGAACGTVGVHTHSDDATGGSSLIGIEEFMYACHEPIFMVGNAIWPTDVYHELHISAMYDGLDMEVDLVWIHPDPTFGCGQLLILKIADPGMYTTYKVNVRSGIGNIVLSGGDVSLDEGTDHLWLIFDGENWCNDVGRTVAGVSGSGAANQVAYWTSANIIDGDPGFTYDPATDVMSLAGGIDITPSGVGDDQIITITPSAALTTENAEWDAIHVTGDALDPSADGVEIHGIHLDFSGISVGSLPHIDGLHVQTPTTYHGFGHGVHLEGLGMRIDHDDTMAADGEFHTLVDVVINDAGSTGGETHALDVARVGGGLVDIAAVGTHTGVAPIHQHVGAFAGSAKAWRYVAIGPAWTPAQAEFDNGGDLQLFAADNDAIYISGTADDTTFDEIEVILTVAASKHIHPVFEYSVGGPAWTVFSPADDTDGFQMDGLIRFSADDLAGWARIDVNAEGTNRYWIRITRTRNNVPTPPTEATIRVLAPTEYYWNELGDLSIHDMSLTGDITLADGHWIGLGAAAGRLEFIDDVPDEARFEDCTYVGIENILYHLGDPDTYLIFSPDFAGFRVGNVDFLYMDEGAQDEFEVNPGEVDIDFIVNANGLADALVVEGATGDVAIATVLEVDSNDVIDALRLEWMGW